jgi:hypothetical protein
MLTIQMNEIQAYMTLAKYLDQRSNRLYSGKGSKVPAVERNSITSNLQQCLTVGQKLKGLNKDINLEHQEKINQNKKEKTELNYQTDEMRSIFSDLMRSKYLEGLGNCLKDGSLERLAD